MKKTTSKNKARRTGPTATAPLIKKRRRASTTNSDNILDRLPQDLIVDIIVQLAASSASPLADLWSVRATSRSFRDASTARDVARCVQMGREQSLRWWNKERYLAALATCAAHGNPEAMFLLGLERVLGGVVGSPTINHDDVHQGTLLLVRAGQEAKYDAANYALGILFFAVCEDDEGRGLGVDAFNELENERRCCSSHCKCSLYVEECRRKVSSAIRDITMERFFLPPPGAGEAACTNSTCGRTTVKNPADGSHGWSTLQQQQFCSPLCRWIDEYSKFFNRL